jgi:hypothetical protein
MIVAVSCAVGAVGLLLLWVGFEVRGWAEAHARRRRLMQAGSKVALTADADAITDRGVRRRYRAGSRFDVLSVVGGVAKVRDGTGCRLLLEVRLLTPAEPDDDPPHDGDHSDGGPVAGRVGRRPQSEPSAA